MRKLWPATWRFAFLCGILAVALGGVGAAAAVEIGQEAPDFSLTATTGGTISLSQFRGKQLVLIEFYSADFAPV
jgi:hypothetical protein